ncbi:hypothetical protein PENSPDRAFT_749519 [Peniophora sp. CONT]|nr:hypothetical protein PENSPDRAFT_749519 [Peniophora sp. CONT]
MDSGLNITSLQDLRATSQSISALVFPVIVETTLFVIFTTIAGVALYTLAEKGIRRSRTNQALLAVLLTTYTMSGTAWAGHLRLVWVDANLAFSSTTSAAVDGGFLPLDVALYYANADFLLIHVCTSVVNLLLGDGLVLWRAYTIWGRPLWLLYLSCSSIFILLCLHVFNAVVFVAIELPTAPANILYLGDIDKHGGAVVCGISMGWTAFCNVLGTSLIGYKAWVHRRDLKQLLNGGSRKSYAGRILALLVESGLIYSALWVLNIPASCPGSGLDSDGFTYYWPLIMAQISGMYPALMLVVVAMQKTRFEDHISAGGKRAEVERQSLSMHFASNHHAASSDVLSTSSPNQPVFMVKETFDDTPYAHVTV